MNTATRISQIQLVIIPSTDQLRSVAFYEALGFEKRSDFAWRDGYRWVELYLPTGATGVAIVPVQPDDPARLQSGIILNTDDIDATHTWLQSIGVDVDPAVARAGAPVEIRIGAVKLAGPVPPMFWFRDPDGNALLMVQPG